LPSSRPLPSALLLVSAVLAACVDPLPRSTIPPEVEYDGCQAVLVPGPVCSLYPKRKLFLWVRDRPEARIEIHAGGRRLDAVGQPVRGGQRFSFKVPPGAERLDVLVEARDGFATWSLVLGTEVRRVRQGSPGDVISELRAIPWDSMIEDRRFAEVREKLDRLELLPKAPAEYRYKLAFYRSMLAEKEGDYRSALAEAQKALEIAERVLFFQLRQRDAQQQLGLLLLALGRYHDAAETFESVGRALALEERPEPLDKCEEPRLLNNQAWTALLAIETGEDFPDPTPLFAKALAMYKACSALKPDKELNILINLALAHLQGGRLAEARERLVQARGLERHASLFYRLWLLDLEARITLAERQPAEALRLFERLESLALAASSPDDRWRAVFGQAQSQEALGSRTAALEALGKAEALLDEQSLQVPLHEGRETFMATRQAVESLYVDLLLKQNRTADALRVARRARSRMLRQLERSDRLAGLAPAEREIWERLIAEYQEKRNALEEQAKDDWALPTDQVHREQAARASQAEELKQLLDRAFLLLGDSGKRRDETPPPLRDGELLLTYHLLPGGVWVGFAADTEKVQVYPFKLPPEVLPQPEELSQRLLLPFRDAIERAKRIRILPSGPLQGVDFHALPFNEDVLLASRPVVYGLDLPASSLPADTPGRRALLVTDPQGDLLGAREEARTVRKTLESRAKPPWTVETLTAAVASAEAVRGRLATVDLLHYAGHGVFSGFGGWDSSLLLAEETRLTLGDLLALDRVPAWVVLSACDGGRSSSEASVEGLGLAQAFLLAGSRAVIASTRPADDRTVPELFAELYRQWDQDPAVALQRAQLAWRKSNPEADWDAFRLFEP
jgi:hypothetical protein